VSYFFIISCPTVTFLFYWYVFVLLFFCVADACVVCLLWSVGVSTSCGVVFMSYLCLFYVFFFWSPPATRASFMFRRRRSRLFYLISIVLLTKIFPIFILSFLLLLHCFLFLFYLPSPPTPTPYTLHPHPTPSPPHPPLHPHR